MLTVIEKGIDSRFNRCRGAEDFERRLGHIKNGGRRCRRRILSAIYLVVVVKFLSVVLILTVLLAIVIIARCLKLVFDGFIFIVVGIVHWRIFLAGARTADIALISADASLHWDAARCSKRCCCWCCSITTAYAPRDRHTSKT